jgi:putative transcription factor
MATGGDGGMDWDEVTVLKKKAPKASEARSDKVVTQALRKGQDVETTKKFSAATNKQKVAAKDTAKLDRETEELKRNSLL